MEILKMFFLMPIEANLILILGIFVNGLAMGTGFGILFTWKKMKKQGRTERLRAKRPWDAA